VEDSFLRAANQSCASCENVKKRAKDRVKVQQAGVDRKAGGQGRSYRMWAPQKATLRQKKRGGQNTKAPLRRVSMQEKKRGIRIGKPETEQGPWGGEETRSGQRETSTKKGPTSITPRTSKTKERMYGTPIEVRLRSVATKGKKRLEEVNERRKTAKQRGLKSPTLHHTSNR